jgi:hypothetical protein
METSQKEYQQELRTLRLEIERKHHKTTEQLYEEREKRVRDAVELRVPDRVPFAVKVDTQTYTGVPNSAAYYDPVGFKRAVRKITVDFEPDMCDTGLPSSGPAMEALGIQNRLWPGGPLPPDYAYQFVEGEYMKADEYDMFISDPADFMIRRYLPRVYTALAPLEKLPPLNNLFMGFEMIASLFTTPEFQEMTRKVADAGRKTAEFYATIGDAYEEMAQLGFPAFTPVTRASFGGAPFDTLSSFLRGMKGSMLDMYRRPEKLLRACEVILERRAATAVPADPNKRGNPKMVGIPLWRGDKVFMSEAQFTRFYWPGLKKALQGSIDLGYIPVPFFEAKFDDRLACLLELPKGKVVAAIEPVDAAKAKEILGDHACILLRAPTSCRVWSLQQVEAYTKEQIDKCGKGGGLILDIRIPDRAQKEDIQAMLESIKEYGRY